MNLAAGTMAALVVPRPEPTPEAPQNMCLDKGYDYREVRKLVAEFGYIAHIKARGEEAKAIVHEAGFKARRWVVERVHSWLNRYRRILIRWEKKAANHLAFLQFACGLIVYQANRRVQRNKMIFG
jgi:transposase